MKLLIDIPEHIYEHAKESTEDSNDEFDAMRAIANGTQQESRSEIPNTCGDAISRQAVLDLAEWFDLNRQHFIVANLIDEVENMPSVSPQQRTGRWERMSDLPNDVDDRFKCSRCGNIVHYNNVMNLRTFSRWCGRCGSYNG